MMIDDEQIDHEVLYEEEEHLRISINDLGLSLKNMQLEKTDELKGQLSNLHSHLTETKDQTLQLDQ